MSNEPLTPLQALERFREICPWARYIRLQPNPYVDGETLIVGSKWIISHDCPPMFTDWPEGMIKVTTWQPNGPVLEIPGANIRYEGTFEDSLFSLDDRKEQSE